MTEQTTFPERDGTEQLRLMVREAISNSYYGARNEGKTMEEAADAATKKVMKLIESVHENAKGYGELLGEERVLEAVLAGGITDEGLATWSTRVNEKLAKA